MIVIWFLLTLHLLPLTNSRWGDDIWNNDEIEDFEPNHRAKRLVHKGVRWPKGIVPYEVGQGLRGIQPLIDKAVKEYEEKTCIRFVPRKSTDQHYVQMERNDDVCGLAHICKVRGVQFVWIGEDCMDYVTVVHEMGHALCLRHEHQRPDRDRYIDLTKCGRGDSLDAFKEKWSTSTLGLMYDYMSVMHYPFCEACMKPTLPNVTSCGGSRLSVLDAEKINAFYSCGGCYSYRFRPQNETFPQPIVAGYDADGAQLGICRAYIQGEILTGKMSLKGRNQPCIIASEGAEHIVTTAYEKLTRADSKPFEWFDGGTNKIPNFALPGGRDIKGESVYIGRCTVESQGKKIRIPGNIKNGKMYYTHDGNMWQCNKFQFLGCKDLNKS